MRAQAPVDVLRRELALAVPVPRPAGKVAYHFFVQVCKRGCSHGINLFADISGFKEKRKQHGHLRPNAFLFNTSTHFESYLFQYDLNWSSSALYQYLNSNQNLCSLLTNVLCAFHV